MPYSLWQCQEHYAPNNGTNLTVVPTGPPLAVAVNPTDKSTAFLSYTLLCSSERAGSFSNLACH